MAGGTWLAVNERGLVAALTNGPSPEGRDPTKRSRGELPLALAAFDDATAAVEHFTHTFHPRDYNRAWLLVGDRRSVHYVDMTGDDTPVVRTLPAGLHILGNGPLDERSFKIDHVRDVVTDAVNASGSSYVDAMRTALSDHTVPAGAAEEMTRRPANRKDWPLELLAACVHIPAEKHGTRSSAVVSVPAAAAVRPSMWVADGPPCTTPYADVTPLWDQPVPG
jgi:uncharacterized protein with NRDE domain